MPANDEQSYLSGQFVEKTNRAVLVNNYGNGFNVSFWTTRWSCSSGQACFDDPCEDERDNIRALYSILCDREVRRVADTVAGAVGQALDLICQAGFDELLSPAFWVSAKSAKAIKRGSVIATRIAATLDTHSCLTKPLAT